MRGNGELRCTDTLGNASAVIQPVRWRGLQISASAMKCPGGSAMGSGRSVELDITMGATWVQFSLLDGRQHR